MTRITNQDQILIQLRAQLERISRSAPIEKTNKLNKKDDNKNPTQRLSELLSSNSLSVPDRRRALVFALISEAFGEVTERELRFQNIIDEVAQIMTDDTMTCQLMDDVLEELSMQES